MKVSYLLLSVSLLASGFVSAEPYIVTGSPGVNVIKYTPITYDLKKIRTTISDARLQFPGEEIFVGADEGYPLTGGPVSFGGLFTYHTSGSLIYGIVQSPKVDGLNPTGLSNFLVRPTSVSPNLYVTSYFNQATTEVGAYFTTTNSVGGVYTDSITIAVNGVEVGTISLPAFTATYVGIRDDLEPFFTDYMNPSNPKSRTVTFTPTLGGEIAPFVADGVYIELTGVTPPPVIVTPPPVVTPPVVTPPVVTTPKVKGKFR
jgi:hypothetical protein